MLRHVAAAVLAIIPSVALAQTHVDAATIRAFMDGCLRTASPSDPNDARSPEDYCKCMAKQLFGDTAGATDPSAAMAVCLPGLGELLAPPPGN